MSWKEMDQVFPAYISDQDLANLTARVLRHEHAEVSSAVKEISKRTGIAPRTIKNWYEARNAPKSKHLLMLARLYPVMLEVVLELTKRSDLPEAALHNGARPGIALLAENKVLSEEIYTDNFVGINVALPQSIAKKLNQRQLWFMGELQRGAGIKADDLVALWGITRRSAERDIRELTNASLIRFNGARKNGRYEMI